MNIRSRIIVRDKVWKQPKCPTTDEWVNETWSVHTIEVIQP